MTEKKYPRTSILTHRESLRDEAQAKHAASIRETEARKRAMDRAEAEADATSATHARVRDSESERLGRGELRAADLQALGAWEIAAAAQAEEARQKVAAAADFHDDGRRHEQAALSELANRRVDVDVLQKDRERFIASERKKTEAREEEASAEAVRPKKG